MSLKIFCDFDGTITHRDTPGVLFAEVKEIHDLGKKYEKKELLSNDFWTFVTKNSRTFVPGEIEEFFRTFPIDETFIPFADFCKSRKLDLFIVSDGLDFYIHGIFEANHIEGVPVFANSAVMADGRLHVTFPFTREHCTMTANCKCLHVLDNAGEEDSIVYIGNGTSDCCPAERSDIVFAKDRLAVYCEANGIPYHNFHTFAEIQLQLEKYAARVKPYKRKAAELKRKELWLLE